MTTDYRREVELSGARVALHSYLSQAEEVKFVPKVDRDLLLPNDIVLKLDCGTPCVDVRITHKHESYWQLFRSLGLAIKARSEGDYIIPLCVTPQGDEGGASALLDIFRRSSINRGSVSGEGPR